MPRSDGRAPDELRPLTLTRRYTRTAAGSVLVEFGGTRVLCTASVQETVPEFLAGKGKGWLTAEYNMLPGSTAPRKARDRGGKVDGRSVEIQRLIGRCLRSVVDLPALGERTLWIDCDVLDADGGTRTASITGAFVAAADALGPRAGVVLRDSIAAVSVGIVGGEPLLDLPYAEDARADVDMNVAMTGRGSFVEVQGSAEGAVFSRTELDRLLELAALGCDRLRAAQEAALADVWTPKTANER